MMQVSCSNFLHKKHVSPNSSANTAGKVAAALFLAALLSGCAVGRPIDKLAADSSLTTGSTQISADASGLDPTDAEAIKLTVADADMETSQSNLLAWSNPETGSSGTITAIDQFVGNEGQSCKKFRTTVDSFMGIALYEGETCELKKGFWVFSWFIRDKSAG